MENRDPSEGIITRWMGATCHKAHNPKRRRVTGFRVENSDMSKMGFNVLKPSRYDRLAGRSSEPPASSVR